MRRHGISGPLTPHEGPPHAFFPVARDQGHGGDGGRLCGCSSTFAVNFPAHLDEIANPADASYVPRPEWYFLSLFELLKYFPGPFEPVATMVIPGLVGRLPVAAAVPRSRPGRAARSAAAARLLTLTMLAHRDRRRSCSR